MMKKTTFINRINERGDLERVEVAADTHVEMPVGRQLRGDDFITPPPSPPSYPAPQPPPETNNIPKANNSSTPAVTLTNGNAKQTPVAEKAEQTVRPLKQYADVDVKALDKNPMHDHIMEAAETFKGRRNEDTFSEKKPTTFVVGGKTSQYNKERTPVKPSQSIHYPVHVPNETKQKKNSLVVNSDLSWSSSKPVERKNTTIVIPKPNKTTLEEKKTESNQPRSPVQLENKYTRIEDVPDAADLLEMIATKDEAGNTIPGWKRTLLARNYRVILCRKFTNK